MFKPVYTPEEILKGIELYSELHSFRKVALRLKISKSTIHRWWHSFRSFLSGKQKHQKRKVRRKKYPNMVADLKALFEAQETPMSLREIQNAIGYGSLSTVHKYLRIAKVSSRSFVPFRVCGKSKDELAIISNEFFKRLNNFSDGEIVCIDETGFSNSGNKLTGYFAKGKTPATFRVKRREKVSVALAISIHGPVSFQIQEKAFSTHSFLQFLKDMLPSLNPSIKAIIMDNIAFHRNEAVKKLLHDADMEILYIPPYTPCCNPIEEVFAAIKRVYYKNQVIDRNIDLRDRVNALMNDRKPYKDFLCYYRHTRSHEKCLCQQSNEGLQS